MTGKGFEELDALAREIAGIAAARWRKFLVLDLEDLRQEAWVAIRCAEATYVPEKGPFAPYAATLARRAVVQAIVRAAAPMSGRVDHRENVKGLVETARGRVCSRTGLDPVYRLEAKLDPAKQLDEAVWRVRALSRVLELLTEDERDAVLNLVAADGERKRGRPRHDLAMVLSGASARLREDPIIRELWESR